VGSNETGYLSFSSALRFPDFVAVEAVAETVTGFVCTCRRAASTFARDALDLLFLEGLGASRSGSELELFRLPSSSHEFVSGSVPRPLVLEADSAKMTRK
jgi:hypothetical protein